MAGAPDDLPNVSAWVQSSVVWDMGERYKSRGSSSAGSSEVGFPIGGGASAGAGAGGAAASMLRGAGHRTWEAQPLLPRHSRRASSRGTLTGRVGRKWTLESSGNSAHWCMVAASVFADVVPYNLLVLFRPAGGLASTMVLLALFSALSLYTADLLSRALVMTGATTLPEAWRDVVGPNTACVPVVTTALVCLACCVGLSTLCGSLVAVVVPILPAPEVFGTSANFWIVLLAVFPSSLLVMLKDVRALFVTTVVACASGLFVALALAARAADGSYAEGGSFFVPGVAMPPLDEHEHVELWQWTRDSLKFVSLMSVMFLMPHANVPKYCRELRREHGQSGVFSRGVGLAIGAGALTVAVSVVAQYLTFGLSAEIILGSYSPNDRLINAARLALGAGLLGCFALAFCGLREATGDLLNVLIEADLFDTVIFQNFLSLVLLALVVAVALVVDGDLVVINAARSTFGAVLVYVLPCFVFLRASRKHMFFSGHCCQRLVVTSISILGIGLAFLGVFVHTVPKLMNR